MAPRLQDNRHINVTSLSALRTGRLYLPQEIFLGLVSVKRLSRPLDHSVAGTLMSMRNSHNIIGNRTRTFRLVVPPGTPVIVSSNPKCSGKTFPSATFVDLKSHMF